MKLAILGYGNLGRGVEAAIRDNPDASLVAVFTRRDPYSVKIQTPNVPVLHVDNILDWQDNIDVLLLCGGSATDLPSQTPLFAKFFNVVDSFDTHANIPKHFNAVDLAAKYSNHVAIISVGWDPGLFSLIRAYSNAFLPFGRDYTFWGNGVSQGHSDAIRRIQGVKNAIQYTVPIDSAIVAVRSGKNPELTSRQKHRRICFVVLEHGADPAVVEQAIKSMPHYFADFDTSVYFISEDELQTKHAGLAHGGFVFRSGKTGMNKEHGHIIEFKLKLDSNPEFTANILVAFARAACRLHSVASFGGKTVFDIPPAYLSTLANEELRAHLL